MGAASPALPATLAPVWEEIRADEQHIAAALEAGDYAALEPLASERHARILSFFEHLGPHLADAPTRLALLKELIGRNAAMLEESRSRLALAADASAQASLARRALGAYQDQRDHR